MAGVGEEEVEYESDSEEAKLSLQMRRREASDDEDEEWDGDGERIEWRERLLTRRIIESDGELESEGAAAEYEDEIEEAEYYEEELEELLEEDYEEERGGKDVVRVAVVSASEVKAEVNEVDGFDGRSLGESTEVLQEANANKVVAVENKENEPFAVPTAGAFYMHDDRFRGNAGGRQRRTLGGRKLWDSKDDKKWGHDKFEEMAMQQSIYDMGRSTSRGRYRGRGRNRVADTGYSRGNRSRASNSSNQNDAPKSVRGRGRRRYEPTMMSNAKPPVTQSKRYGKSVEKSSSASSGKPATPASSVESDPVPPKNQVFASSLSSASPPFYPSSSSNKDATVTQKRDAQAGTSNPNFRPSTLDERFSLSQTDAMLRLKNIVDSIGMDKFHLNESIPPAAVKPSTKLRLPTAGSSLIESSPSPRLRAQGRSVTPMGQMTCQPKAPYSQQLAQRPCSGSQASSPPKAALPINSFEPGVLDSPPEPSKLKNTLVARVMGSVQGSGSGSFMYDGAQVMGASGNMGRGQGDQNFMATSAFLPVMQFGGQHPGGIGVPAVGMAFPGYVAQPQLGLGNSEMTWLPVLAGAAGALGATYCSPYVAVDGSYHARPSGQISSLATPSSKEYSANKPCNEWEPSQTPDIANDEFGQQQNKTRSRYTEMKFSRVK